MAGRRKGKVDAEGNPLKTAQQILEEVGLTQLCDWITEGRSYREMSQELGISVGALHHWLNAKDERVHACARARELAAQSFDEKAMETIESAGDPFELAKARELAVHYRWRAKAVNPKKYGDKQQVDVSGGLDVTLFDGMQAERMMEHFLARQRAES